MKIRYESPLSLERKSFLLKVNIEIIIQLVDNEIRMDIYHKIDIFKRNIIKNLY